MKKITFVTLLLFIYGFLGAQTAFTTRDSININNINEMVLVHGDMGWDPALGVAHCYFPDTTPRSINFTNSIWLAGYDSSGVLHTAAQTYRQMGNDYWPGPLDSTGTLTYTTSSDWAKIWKVNRTDINAFLGLTSHTVGTTPLSILTWPGKGNIYAAGLGGVPLTVTTDMAPFVDLNGNGVYEPLLGEYPDVKGDQSLWMVFSDNGPTHNETNGNPLGVEVHASIYAYKRGTLIDNVVYYQYDIVNKSANNYSNFRFGLWDDMDMGYFDDDYIGFDSTHRMGITYNGDNNDTTPYLGDLDYYGRMIPVSGVTMISLPGDSLISFSPVGNFTFYDNSNSDTIGNPSVDTQYNNYMRGKNKLGRNFQNDFTGPGHVSTCYGSGPATNYVYTGNPSDSTGWSECVCGNPPGDRRFLISTQDFTLYAGATQRIVAALVTTNPDSLNGCPSSGFGGLGVVADTAWTNYFTSVLGVKNVQAMAGLKIYPNPAHDQLFIENPSFITGRELIQVYNVMGQNVNVSFSKTGSVSVGDISRLPSGMYFVLYNNGNVQSNTRFIKD